MGVYLRRKRIRQIRYLPLEIERLWFSDSDFSGRLGYVVHSILDVQLKIDEESIELLTKEVWRTGLSLYWVNLDNGEKYGYGRKYDSLPDFEYNGETYWPAGYRVVYHKGLLWYEVFISGYAFILAIYPETGEYHGVRI